MSALPPKSPSTVAPFSDALGYRVLGFDKKSGDRLEMLRLRPQLASAPAFEAAVRDRQKRLVEFRHAAFARVRQIDRPTGQTAALAIVSNYADGQRLSELLRQAQNNGVALELIAAVCMLQQMVAAVAHLHAVGAEVAHGALNPERVTVTPAGRVVLTEYVVGAGLSALGLTPQQTWQDYRLPVPADVEEPFGQAADVYQLGYLGLTLVCGKSIYDRHYPPPFATTLNGATEIAADGRPQPLHPAIVSWLTRALRLGGPFASVADAQAALDEAIASAGLVATADVVAQYFARATGEPDAEPATMIGMPAPVIPAAEAPAQPEPEPLSAPKAAVETPWTPPAPPEPPEPAATTDRVSGPHGVAAPAMPEIEAAPATPVAEAPAEPDVADLPMHAEAPAAPELPPAQVWTPKKAPSAIVPRPSGGHAAAGRTSGSHPVASRAAGAAHAHPTVHGTNSFTRTDDEAPESGGSRKLVMFGAAAALVAIAGAAYVFNPFGGGTTGAAAAPAPAAAPATPTSAGSGPDAAAPSRARTTGDTGRSVAQPAPAPPAFAETPVAAPPPPAPGFVTIDAPEELQVIEDGNILGISGAARLSLAPGSHLIEFRNDNLGFQTTRTVQVLPGKTTRVSIPLPEGNLSINATPWAEVFLDGRGLGETPIANVTTRAGTHELIFRHPQHGELKQTVVVKAGELGRVTVNMVR